MQVVFFWTKETSWCLQEFGCQSHHSAQLGSWWGHPQRWKEIQPGVQGSNLFWTRGTSLYGSLVASPTIQLYRPRTGSFRFFINSFKYENHFKWQFYEIDWSEYETDNVIRVSVKLGLCVKLIWIWATTIVYQEGPFLLVEYGRHMCTVQRPYTLETSSTVGQPATSSPLKTSSVVLTVG